MYSSKFLICATLYLMLITSECAREAPMDLHSLSIEFQEAIAYAAPALYVMERVKKLARNDAEKKIGLGTLLKFHNTAQ